MNIVHEKLKGQMNKNRRILPFTQAVNLPNLPVSGQFLCLAGQKVPSEKPGELGSRHHADRIESVQGSRQRQEEQESARSSLGKSA